MMAGGQGQLWLGQREARRGKLPPAFTALAPARRLLQPTRRQASDRLWRAAFGDARIWVK